MFKQVLLAISSYSNNNDALSLKLTLTKITSLWKLKRYECFFLVNK